MKMNRELSEVIGMFAFPGTFVEAIPYGNGHINDTYRLTFEQSGRLVHYILQQMNRKVFRKPEELMEYRRSDCVAEKEDSGKWRRYLPGDVKCNSVSRRKSVVRR